MTEISREITIAAGGVELKAQLNESNTATEVLGILPLAATVNLWGDEIYFPIPLETGLENPKETVALGDIAYWPQGKAMCIFFGQTPVSQGEEIRPISPVNVIGKVAGELELLRQVKPGETITIRR